MTTGPALYDPLTDPFHLPVQTLRIDCEADRPLWFPPRAGATPGTTLWGAFGDALLAEACVRARADLGGCGDAAGTCLSPEACPLRWLYKPWSDAHSRTMARPVLLRAVDLEREQGRRAFRLEATLWGRKAIAARPLIERTLRRMGERGLRPGGDAAAPVPFRLISMAAEPPATLAERAAARPAGLGRVALVFETPYLLKRLRGMPPEAWPGGAAVTLAEVLGNAAYELAAWDMEDRELSAAAAKSRHRLCLDARDAARAAAGRLAWVDGELFPAEVGPRLSRSNAHAFPLRGFVGYAEYAGEGEAAWPWLLALALGGGGEKRPWGFGRVRVAGDWE